MIAVIKGDIIGSRTVPEAERWLQPLKEVLGNYGQSPQDWEIAWGDALQLQIPDGIKALETAVHIKATIKAILPADQTQNNGPLDIRMAIGMGEMQFQAERIAESNGTAFVCAGDAFDQLKQLKTNLLLSSGEEDFDEMINLYLQLSLLFMDNWTTADAALVKTWLKNPNATQSELGEALGIKQNSVSGRWKRAHVTELKAVMTFFEKRYTKTFGQ